MKAVYIEKHGRVADLKVSERPEPSVNSGEVVVKVEAAGINPSDLASLEGKFPVAVLPRIIGRDFAGRVVKGPSDLMGNGVWGTGGDLGITRDGTHAEYISVPRLAAVRCPKKLSVEQAGSVGVPFITAFSALVSLGRLKRGQWVIISGAAGAVGQAAIQVANAKGAHIVALVKGTSDGWVSKLPGVCAVAYSERGDLPTVVRAVTAGKGANLALNGVGASVLPSILQSLIVGGRLVIYSVAGGREFNLDLQFIYRNELRLLGLDTQKLSAPECAAILNELTPMFDSGALTPPKVNEHFPLTKASEAYARVAAGKSGKVVLLMQ